MNRLCFHVQHHGDSGGHYKQQNMLGLGKKNWFLDFNRFSFLLTNIDYLIPIDAIFSWWMNSTESAPSIQ